MGKRSHNIDIHGAVQDADELVELLKPVFAEQDPEIVGAALAQLNAIFIAGHAPSLRDASRELLVNLMDELVPTVIEEMIEQGRVPPDWRWKDLQ